MIAADIVQKLRDDVANGIGIERVGDYELVIYMPFIFDDGDHCGFALRRDSKGWKLADDGETVRRAGYSGVDVLDEGHSERFRNIVKFYGVTEHNGKLSLPVDDDRFSESIFMFTQVCLEVTNLAKMPKERQVTTRSHFSEQLASVIEPIVPPSRFEVRWTHPTHDPDRLYPVDYLIRGREDNWFVFGVPGVASCMMATITCLHYRMASERFKALAIYGHEEELRVRFTTQLNEVADKTFPRIAERNSIRAFIESHVV